MKQLIKTKPVETPVKKAMTVAMPVVGTGVAKPIQKFKKGINSFQKYAKGAESVEVIDEGGARQNLVNGKSKLGNFQSKMSGINLSEVTTGIAGLFDDGSGKTQQYAKIANDALSIGSSIAGYSKGVKSVKGGETASILKAKCGMKMK